MPRYQKKHEIENHLGLSINGSHFLGGALQRDEAAMLKLKKEEQQRQMQLVLKAQIEEKNKKALRERESRLSFEVQEEDRVKKDRIEAKSEENLEKSPIHSSKFENSNSTNYDRFQSTQMSSFEKPSSNLEKSPTPKISDYSSRSPKTMIVFTDQKEAEEQPAFLSPPISPKRDGKNESLDYLSQLCKQLIDEQEHLKGKIKNHEDIIENMRQTREEPKRSQNSSALRRKPPSKILIPQSKANQLKLKQQHELENAKINAIQEKIDAARRKKEQLHSSKTQDEKAINQRQKANYIPKPRTVTNSRRISDVTEVRPESGEDYTPNNQLYRLQSAFTPCLPPESPELPSSSQSKLMSKDFTPNIPHDRHSSKDSTPNIPHDRHNLDSAGKSYFIYPDSEGAFSGSLVEDNKLKQSDHSNHFFEDQSSRNSLQADELDKFIQEHDKRSPYISQFNSARTMGETQRAKFTSTTYDISRKEAKPLVANKAGFPSNIFRRP